MNGTRGDGEGFVAFYRRYTRTWLHALATAALTAFGTLTFVDRAFAVLAVAAYVVPPVVLYLGGSSARSLARLGGGEREAAGRDSRPSPAADRRTSTEADGSETGDDRSETTDDRSETVGTAPGSGAESASASEAGGSEARGSTPGWTTAAVPTEETLCDVSVGDGSAYAVGADGTVLADEGDGWSVALADGPGARSNALAGVDATDGGAVWFAGDGGAVGRLDPSTGRHVDHSAPDGDTTNLGGVAAVADGDGETVLLVDGSGRVRRGRYRGGEVAWDEPATPGSGSSVAGVTLLDGSIGFVCDTAGSVFEVRDGGRRFRRIGLDAAAGTLTDVAAAGADAPAVGADDGVVHRYDGTAWTPVRLDEEPVRALAVGGDRWIAVGDAGVAFERARGAADWDRVVTPATVPLRGVSVGASRAVAVGADGTVVGRTVDRLECDRSGGDRSGDERR